jgi:hypothetical protein
MEVKTMGYSMLNLGVIVFAVLSAVIAYPVMSSAQTPPQSDACFDVVEPGQRSELSISMLVNRCTGATWLLVRHQSIDDKGRSIGQFTYTWHPIQVALDPPQFINSPTPGIPYPNPTPNSK